MEQPAQERPRKPGTFKPGFDERRDVSNLRPAQTHRPVGAVNRITRDLKQGITEAAELHGSDGKGAGGLPGYLFWLAGKHPKAFAGLLGKLLPLQVNAQVGHHIASVNIVSVPTDNFLSAADIVRLSAPGNTESQPTPSRR